MKPACSQRRANWEKTGYKIYNKRKCSQWPIIFKRGTKETQRILDWRSMITNREARLDEIESSLKQNCSRKTNLVGVKNTDKKAVLFRWHTCLECYLCFGSRYMPYLLPVPCDFELFLFFFIFDPSEIKQWFNNLCSAFVSLLTDVLCDNEQEKQAVNT